MVKAVFIDLDGTLLNSKHEISLANKKALEALEDNNILYFIATGRPDQLVKKIVHDLSYDREMIMMNGSVIGHPFKSTRVRDLVIDQSYAEAIIAHCLEHNYLIMLYTHYAIFSEDNERVRFFKNKTKDEEEALQPVFKPLSAYQGEGINKILVVEHNPDRYQALKRYLKAMPLSCVQSQIGFLDINPQNATKGSALKILSDKYQLQAKEVIAFGDQDNDLSMRDYVSQFIAMGNAQERVKAVADDITLDHDHDGVASWINKNILK